ncbi:MAG: glycosyl transferase family 2 [Phycisphaerales bacterium]|nr:glycosyl transferase family 2 [Phycisphaerales bacterium]
MASFARNASTDVTRPTLTPALSLEGRGGKVPTVSVVMPVYNAQRYLASAVDSVLAQTFGDFELIVVDDGSKDDSLTILRQFESRDPRVRVLSRPNTGIVGALNDGLKLARGEFVARMDADDLCLPERFARQVAYLRTRPECVLVGSQVLLIDPDDAPICLKSDTKYTHEEIDHWHLNRGWPVVHPSIMMRRDAVEKIGGYREEYKWLEDTDLFLRLAEVGKLANLPDTLLRYRLHFQSICHTHNDEQGPLKLRLYEETRRRRGMKLEQDARPMPAVKSDGEQHRLWAWWALGAGNVATARKHAFKTFRKAPLSFESWRVMACAVRGH